MPPNPFRANGLIEFERGARAGVRVAVCDIAGREMREMDPGEMPEGTHPIAWDGLDHSGRAVSAGVYLVKVVSGSATSTGKVVLLG